VGQARQEQLGETEAGVAAGRRQRHRSPGRPRDPAAEGRILDAAIEEYLETGAAGFTIDGVARRAGVGKSTVYLRWSDKNALIVDSMLARSAAIEHVDTGSLRDDLVALAGNLLRFLLDPVGFATFRITVDAVASQTRQQVATELAARHRSAAARVFDRARERGELLDPAAVQLVAECLYGAVTVKVISHGLADGVPGDDALAASCVATVDLLLPLLRRSPAG